MGHKLLVQNERILLKRTNMSENSFSFQSQWKTGRVIKAIPGGGGNHGDHIQSWLTAEQVQIVKPPLPPKTQTKETKTTKASNNLQMPKSNTKEARKSVSPAGVKARGVTKKLSNMSLGKPAPPVAVKGTVAKKGTTMATKGNFKKGA